MDKEWMRTESTSSTVAKKLKLHHDHAGQLHKAVEACRVPLQPSRKKLLTALGKLTLGCRQAALLSALLFTFQIHVADYMGHVNAAKG